MIIPSRNTLLSNDAARVLLGLIADGSNIPQSEMKRLLPRLGYWDLVHNEAQDDMSRAAMLDATGRTDLWELFDEILGDTERSNSGLDKNLWLFGALPVIEKHPAYGSGKRLEDSQFVSLNVDSMKHQRMPFDLKRTGFDFIGLGGVDSIGASCYAYRCGDEVLLIDVGINPQTGALPDMEALPLSWRDKITGIVLTHLHADHSGGLLHYKASKGKLGELYFMNGLPPIYCSSLTKALFPKIMEIAASHTNIPCIEPEPMSSLIDSLTPLQPDIWHKIGNIEIKLVDLPHAPGSVAVMLRGSEGIVLHAVDFAVDRPFGGCQKDILKVFAEGEPVEVLVLDSTYGCVENSTQGLLRQLRISNLMDLFLSQSSEKPSDLKERRLFPAFSLGRAQELYAKLEEKEPDTTVMCGAAETVSSLVVQHAPEWFSIPISRINTAEIGRRNIIASHGWLETDTASWNWLGKLRKEDKVVFTGYVSSGSNAHKLLDGRLNGYTCNAQALPFSSHGSLPDLAALVVASAAKRVILVHGTFQNIAYFALDDLLVLNGKYVHRSKVGEQLCI